MTFVITMERKIASRKMLHENDPQVWATLFSQFAIYVIKEKSQNRKAMIPCKTRAAIGQKRTNYKHLALKQTNNKPKFRQSLACEHFGRHGKHNKFRPQVFSYIQQKCNLPVEIKPDTCEPWYLCGDLCVICNLQCVLIWDSSSVLLCADQTVNQFSKRWTAHRGT